jgi:hypothetical protein
VADAVYGLYQLALFGQNLKYTAAVATAVAHVAANNQLKVADLGRMHVEQSV